jgi:hypothetical protein
LPCRDRDANGWWETPLRAVMPMRATPDHFLAQVFGTSIFSDANQVHTFVKGDPNRPLVPRPELKRFIRGLPGMLGWGEGEREAALVMLSTIAICSRDAKAVSRYSGVALAVVKKYFERLAAGGIWMPDGSVRAHWADPELGLKAFWRDVLLATGKVRQRQVVAMPPGEEPQ